MSSDEFKDKRYKNVSLGDTVAFAAGGKSGGLRIGKVVRKELRKRYFSSSDMVPVLIINYPFEGRRNRMKNIGVALTQSRVGQDILVIDDAT